MDQNGYAVAIVGATGEVGQAMIKTLERYPLPVKSLKLLASRRSAGKQIAFKQSLLTVEELTHDSFENIEIALFSAGGDVSKTYVPSATKAGALVIDNTSVFRMVEEIPLVVPELNISDVSKSTQIIANPNCSTIQLVMALAPLQEAYGIERVDVSTYQAVSGAGAKAIQEYELECQNSSYEPKVLPVRSEAKHYQMVGNVIPQIDVFLPNGYTKEEIKMINETKKILHEPKLSVSATCVRVPVIYGHSVSATIKLNTPISSKRELLMLVEKTSYLTLLDDCDAQIYPMPIHATTADDVFVGRIRQDLFDPTIVHLFIVANNILKGAALNSVQIATTLHQIGWFGDR